ncbi:MAG: GntR family transcriptional regulator [Azospirillaceae bacterium]
MSTSQADRAYERIEEAIVTLTVAPGSIVTEQRLMAMARVGRTPAREAIQRLAGFGVLRPRARLGIEIGDPNPMDQLQVLQTRAPLEAILVAGATALADARQRQALRDCAASMRRCAAADEPGAEFGRRPEGGRGSDRAAHAGAGASAGFGGARLHAFLRLDRLFDRIVGEAAHNRHAAGAVAPLQLYSRWFWCRFLGDRDLVPAAAAHWELAEAISASDRDGAARALDHLMGHLGTAARSVLDRLLPDA